MKNSNGIKVCHMTDVHGEEDNRIFNKECVSLAEAGYEVYLVQRGKTYNKNGVHIIGAGDLPKSRLKRMSFGAFKVFKIAYALNCDIYHIHDPELIPYGVKLHKKGKKVIFDSHELYRVQIKIRTNIGPIISNIYSYYEKKVLPLLDGLIFPCPIDGKNPYEGLYKEFEYINNVPKLTDLYDRYVENDPEKEDAICYIGSITRHRGITNIIKASSMANVKLYLAGNFDNNDYMREIQQMPEYKNVEYLGNLDRNGIVALLKKVRVGMATLLNVGQYNLSDNLPTKVYEYMAMGIPSIISETPYNCYINEKYHFGITVDPNNIQEISSALNKIISDPIASAKMAKNGRYAVKNEFNWETESKKLISLYTRIHK